MVTRALTVLIKASSTVLHVELPPTLCHPEASVLVPPQTCFTLKNQTALQLQHLGGYSKRAVKSYSRSFRVTCDKSTASLFD